MHSLTPSTEHATGTRRATALTAALAFGAVAVAGLLIWTEISDAHASVNWTMFAVLALALVACERLPRTWIRFGPIGVVTPIWMFGYGLLLVGSPALGVGVALLGATLHAMGQASAITGLVHRVSTTAISLSIAGLVLAAMGVGGAITQYDRIPWDWAVAIVFAGLSILLTNALLAAITLSVRRRVPFFALLRRGLATRVTAEGAMLSLAPIWVIGIDFSPVLVPLLAITTVLVFRSTREALERSHEAFHDPLTGLVNRRAFFDHLKDALADSRPTRHVSVLIMDLNGFKDVNDRLGHQIGDALLMSFADRLEHSLPAEALVARLGGDEFAVLLVAFGDRSAVKGAVAQIHERLVQPLTVDGFPVSVGVSIGAATSPDDGRTPRDLVRAADVAMYKAKRTGSSIEHYDSCVKGPQRGRLNLLGDLGEALHRDQFQVYFQPQLRISDGEVDTVEALIRWNHPVHGWIPPNEFVGLAEQTDLILPITNAVLRMATRALLTAGAKDVKLAVNVSARSLQQPDFASELFTLLRQTGFPADRLELEVTERALVSNAERSRFTIKQLRDAGIRIAIDDFGVGYSSFQTLRLLDVDRVKVDRDFVKGLLDHPRDRLLVASLVQLAHALDLDVVAEGVENMNLWDAVAALDCDIAQGYGIAMPMAFTELRGWLSQWQNAVVTIPNVEPASGSQPARYAAP